MFQQLFFRTKSYQPSIRDLSTVNFKSYQPSIRDLTTFFLANYQPFAPLFINSKCEKLPTLKFNII
jgi:hypothetical protein